MTRLRKMMLEELQRRNYSEITTRKYLQYVTAFARHFGKSPDQLGPNELRSYQAYLLQERKVTPGTAVNCVAALRFFFVKTLKRHQFREFLPYPKDHRRLPTVLSPEEVSRLINAARTVVRRHRSRPNDGHPEVICMAQRPPRNPWRKCASSSLAYYVVG